MMDIDSGRPIFIVGCPRSGTTLLRNLLSSHPHLTFPEESHFIPEFYRGYGNPRDEAQARMLAERVLSLQWVSRWGLELEAQSFADCRSFRELLCRLYEAWARRENKPRWGDKTPNYVTEIPLLVTLFPGARIIHIYRDGRDTALSWIRIRYQPQNVYTAARLWKSFVGSGRQAGAALPRETYLEVCYEKLLEQPRETMQRVCEFIGEPFDEAVLGFSRRKPDLHTGAMERHSSRQEIRPGNRGKWRKQMLPRDRVVFESVAGDLLEALGYETEGRTRRISGPERLGWNLHQGFCWTMRRLRTLHHQPYRWSVLQMVWARARSRFSAA
ncbi:MAG: sulfotransferase family protein [Bryobacteraceae bacterium]